MDSLRGIRLFNNVLSITDLQAKGLIYTARAAIAFAVTRT